MPLPPDIKLGLTIPGEALAVAIIEAVTENRRTMSQENRDKFDAMFIKSIEDGNKFWGLLFNPIIAALEKLETKP